jgi:Domain of unknown function (DUF4915)
LTASPRIWNDALYLLESFRGWLVRIDRHSGKREDVTFCPGFARGMAFVSHYAVVTVSLPRHANFGGLPLDAAMKASGAMPRCGLLVIDPRNGDMVRWFRFRGDVTELFDVGVIENIRCPRGYWAVCGGVGGGDARGGVAVRQGMTRAVAIKFFVLTKAINDSALNEMRHGFWRKRRFMSLRTPFCAEMWGNKNAG